MRPRRLHLAFLCTLSLLGSSAGAPAMSESRQAAAQWISQQLHRSVDTSQILAFPDPKTWEGCAISDARHEATGTTSIFLRCPNYVLPQLLLLSFSAELDDILPGAVHSRDTRPASGQQHVVPLVRAGAPLWADWRTDSLHAQLPVVALDSGVAGAEIRVRIVNTNRIMHARIDTAKSVTIIMAGA